MKNLPIILASIAIVLSAVATFKSVVSNGNNVSAEAVETALNENPKMVYNALEQYQKIQKEEAEKAARELLTNNLDEINSTEKAPFIGSQDATITVVEFFDFSCGYCKRLEPELKKVIAANPDVKFVFKPLSFLGPMSNYMAKAAIAANAQGKFFEVYQRFLEAQTRLSEAEVDAIISDLGLDNAKYKSDMDSREVTDALQSFSSIANKIQVNGVPTVIINGKHVQTLDAAVLQDAINANK